MILMRGIRPLGWLFWLVVIAVAVGGLYIAGGFVTKQGIAIGGCRAEWDTIARNVQSELCPDPNVTCRAEPYIMQHNAIVDALLCACAEAGPDYTDAGLNRQIEEAYAANTNLTLGVREVCEGGQLAKWRYG